MRRFASIRGVDDQVNIDLGSNVSLIHEVLNHKAASSDGLSACLTLSGEDMKIFLQDYCQKDQYEEFLIADHRYVLTVQDW